MYEYRNDISYINFLLSFYCQKQKVADFFTKLID